MIRVLLLACAALLAAAPAAARPATPAVWEVRDADTTITLFGTFHMLPPGAIWFDGPVRRRFEDADLLVVEAVLPDDPAVMQAVVAQKGIGAPDAPLTGQLSPQDAARLEAAAAKAGLPLAALQPMRPWFAAVTLAAVSAAQLGFDPARGADVVLKDAARAAGKPIHGFETVAEQLSFFADRPQEEQVLLLSATLRDLDRFAIEAPRMLADWSGGDARAVARALNASLKDVPGLGQALLQDRNARWADWIAARMDAPGRVFVAVGVGHLAGAGSVQDKLRAKGIRARRVR